MTSPVRADRPALRQLIQYVVRESQADERFGRTKLFKLLFFIDFESLRGTRRSVSGATYEHWEHGPVPIEAVEEIDSMVNEGVLARAQRNYYGKLQETYFSLFEPKITEIGDAIPLINKIVRENYNLNASEIREKSHEFIGYDLTRIRQVIPHETASFASEPPTENDVKWALDANTTYGWTRESA